MTDSSDDDAVPNEEQLHDLIAEYNRRLDQGESIDPAQFASEHPEVQGELSRYFENVATLESLAGPTASQVHRDPTETVITGETHDGGHTETMIENSSSGNAARISKDAPSTQFGRYRILKELGRGAMGAVYLAKDEQLDREVALKIPKFDSDMNADLLERFHREARAAAALQHPGICPVFDVGELDGQHYITMGFIKGRPLRDFTKSSKRQEGKQVARVIRKIAMAMAEAHEQNVIHRDLKPANIMIDRKNEPVVMDFGLARRSAEGEEQLTHTGTVIGTPAYMSPEQVDGDNENVGPHSDIYSLGVIFYEMLTGQLPFQGNLMLILKQIALTEPQPPVEIHADIDSSLQAICLKMMAKKSEDRPASMSNVARDLTTWLQGRQVVADEIEPLETSRVPGQQASDTDEPTVHVGQTGMPVVDVKPEATFTRTTPRTGARRVPPKNKKFLIAAGLSGAALLLAGIAFFVQLGKVKVQITVDDPSLALKVDDGDIVIEGSGKPIRLSAGPHKLLVERDGLKVFTDEFVVEKNGVNSIRVTVVNDEVFVLKNGEDVPKEIRPPTNIVADEPRKAEAEEWSLEVEFAEHTKFIQALAFNSDGSMLASLGGGEKTAHLWELRDARKLLSFDLRETGNSVSISKDDKSLIVGKNSISIWNTTSGLQNPGGGFAPSSDNLFFRAISDDHSLAARIGPTNYIEILRLPDLTRQCLLANHTDEVRNVAFHPNNHIIGSVSDDLSVRLWNADSGAVLKVLNGHMRKPTGLAFSADGTVLATCAGWEELKIWDVGSGEEKQSLDLDDDLLDVALSPDGTLVAAAAGTSSVVIWNTETAALLFKSESGSRGFRVKFAPDGKQLAVGRKDGRIEVWNVPASLQQGNTPGATAGLPSSANTPSLAIAPFDAATAKQHQQAWATHLGVPVEYTNSIGMKFRLIPPGEFLMGSTPEEIEAAIKLLNPKYKDQLERHIRSEAPQHRVILTQPVYLGVYEVTQAEYEKVMGMNPSCFAPTGTHKEVIADMDTAHHPVDTVSWNDATEFCAKLSEQEKFKPFYFRAGETVTPLDGTGYRLPGEAQWEFACRAGTTTKFWSGDKDEELMRVGWFGWDSGKRTHRVGELQSNPFGLADMHGNVREWVHDGWDASWYGQFLEKPAINPFSPPSSNGMRVARGGNWDLHGVFCRSSARGLFGPTARDHGHGFRVSLPVDAVKEAIVTGKTPGATGSTTFPPLAVAPFDADTAKQHQQAWAKYLGVPVETTNSIGMKFVVVPAGKFAMGEDVVSVTLTKPFRLGVHEVTMGQWKVVMETAPIQAVQSHQKGDDVAITYVNCDDATEFCRKLTGRDRVAGKLPEGWEYRLPTEAEWEWACRAGTITAFSFGDDIAQLGDYAWFASNSQPKDGSVKRPVGTKKPNPFGLHDIHGNVREWCSDWYGENLSGGTDPLGPQAGSQRVNRGGSYYFAGTNCRSADRHSVSQQTSSAVGFRVALSPLVNVSAEQVDPTRGAPE